MSRFPSEAITPIRKLERIASGVKLRDGFPSLNSVDAKELLAALRISPESAHAEATDAGVPTLEQIEGYAIALRLMKPGDALPLQWVEICRRQMIAAWGAKQPHEPRGDVATIRTAVADYMRSEGCACCRDTDAHEVHRRRLAELLHVPGHPEQPEWNDFSPYETGKQPLTKNGNQAQADCDSAAVNPEPRQDVPNNRGTP